MSWKDARPMSPHLQIYRLPLTALMSITHRITGVALCAGSVLLIWALARAAQGPDAYALAHAILSSFLGQLVLFGFTLALYAHLCHGIRHLFWDAGHGFEIENADKYSRLSLGAAVGLTLITWLIALL